MKSFEKGTMTCPRTAGWPRRAEKKPELKILASPRSATTARVRRPTGLQLSPSLARRRRVDAVAPAPTARERRAAVDATRARADTVTSVLNSALVIELKEGKSWVPAALQKGDTLPSIRVTQIDTGAGTVRLTTKDHPDGVVVATVVKGRRSS